MLSSCGDCAEYWGWSAAVGTVLSIGGGQQLWGLSLALGMVSHCGDCPKYWGWSAAVGTVLSTGGGQQLWGLSWALGVASSCGDCPEHWGWAASVGTVLSTGSGQQLWGLSWALGVVSSCGGCPEHWGCPATYSISPFYAAHSRYHNHNVLCLAVKPASVVTDPRFNAIKSPKYPKATKLTICYLLMWWTMIASLNILLLKNI
jgi:bacterioferritin-associated ferredoxin